MPKGNRGKRGPEPSLRSQWLGQYLRDLRNENDMTLEDAAAFLQRDASMLSRYEKAEYPIRRGDVLALITLYGVSDEDLRNGLLQLADDIWRKGWWDPYAEDFGKTFIDHPWLESRATEIRIYHSMFVPGLLQTEDYATAMIRNADQAHADEQQIERWVELRMKRQQVLSRDEPLRLSAVIEEWVLRRPIGNTETARGQLRHLVEVAQRPTIDVRVMPADHGPHAGHLGSFELFHMPVPYPEVAYVESLAGALYVEQPNVERFAQAYDGLYQGALSPEKSVELISAIAEET